jgi:hypothetical protein
MRQVIGLQRFFQRLRHVFLSNDILKSDRTVFSGGDDESHLLVCSLPLWGSTVGSWQSGYSELFITAMLQ